MSRLDRFDVWEFRQGNLEVAFCPCCIKDQENVMIRSESSTWQIEHIIKMKNGGADILDNTVPICVDCNTANKPYDTTFDYMAKIGVLSYEYALHLKLEHYSKIDFICKNPHVMYCNAFKKNGEKCNLKKKPNNNFCSIHSKIVEKSLNTDFHDPMEID